ncbi:MAG: hypothetical protein ABIA77_06660 [Candidatus Omnitrophota bacterium]
MFNRTEEEWGKGRATQQSGYIDTSDISPELADVNEYIGSHTLLPKDYQDIPEETVITMGKLLFEDNIARKTRQAVLIILAHQNSRKALEILRKYSAGSDKDLRIFAGLALDECMMWNDA